MGQPQQNIALTTPAFQGVNTEDSPLTQDVTFALRANNAVIDVYGRIGARKGFFTEAKSIDLTNVTSYSGIYTSTKVNIGSISHSEGLDVICVAEVEYYGSITDTAVATERFLCQLQGTALVALTHSAGALASINTVEGKLAQIVNFAGQYFVFVQGQEAVEVAGTSATLLKDGAGFLPPQDDTGNLTNGITGGVACSAYGRLWISGVGGNFQEIWYSDLGDARVWYDGKAVPTEPLNTAGGLDVSQYWPSGRDSIKNIKAHNNGLVVFGRNSILLYGNAQGDPAAIGGIFLQDAITGMGLVSRDAVVETGVDLLFVDDSGVRSLGRTMQEQSVPVGDITANVRSDITSKIAGTVDKSSITLAYWPSEALIVCNFSSEGYAYAIDARRPSGTGGSRITTWTEVLFDRSVYYEEGNDTYVLLGGKAGDSICRYTGQVDAGETTYQFTYESTPLSFGDSVRQKFPKKVNVTTIGSTQPTNATVRWGFGGKLEYSKAITSDANAPAFWGESQWGEALYGSAEGVLGRHRVNTKGSGAYVSVGVDATIEGGEFSIQELNLQLLIGRVY
jgi:hypothetical protein